MSQTAYPEGPPENSWIVGSRRGDTQRAAAFEEVRSVWESLPAAYPLQSYTWAQACVDSFPSDGLQIVTAGSPNTRAIAAFVASKDSRALVPLGAELYEPTEFIYADARAAEELSDAIAGLGVPIFIRDMFAGSSFLEALKSAAGRRLVVQPVAGHPWLELDDSWLEPESHLNAGRRSDLRRAQRNASKVGPVSCEIVTPTPDTLEGLLNEAYLVEAAGWKGSEGSALAADSQVGGFYWRYAQAACKAGTLRIGILRIGDQAAAMQLAVEENQCFWLFKMGFNESFARFSPGTLLMVESLRTARQRGCNQYELMGKSEDWNRIWMPRLHDAVSLNLCAPNIRGWVSVVAENAKIAIKTQVRDRMRKSNEPSGT
ncbi:MAG: hypothetical protein CXZ00_13595 [Acidobacteria bacterium]|nr:MAG: hypothetical protein CXZ00_13595 [Acidobacteriota bacterium]